MQIFKRFFCQSRVKLCDYESTLNYAGIGKVLRDCPSHRAPPVFHAPCVASIVARGLVPICAEAEVLS